MTKRSVPRARATFLDGNRRERLEAQHKRPKKQEEKVASSIGGRRQRGSGSSDFAKGDVSRDADFPLLVECKRSMGKESIRVEARWLTKITAEAQAVDKYPALAIQFDDEVMKRVAIKHGGAQAESDWMAVPLSTFQGMLEALGDG